jgi:integrase
VPDTGNSSAFVFRPDLGRLKALGFRSVAYVPVLFHKSGEYARAFNHYLRARALAEWPEEDLSVLDAPHYPASLTLAHLANDLCNFVQFVEDDAVHLDWRSIKFDPDLLLYRDLQLEGRWSARATDKRPVPLSDGTVRRRLITATDCLVFAAAKGYREAFVAPARRAVRTFVTERSIRTGARIRRHQAFNVRQKPIDLRIPTKEELHDWLQGIETQSGYTKALAAKTTLKLALRRNECAQMRVTILPLDQSGWRASGDNLVVRLANGTKFGKERSIVMPISLAQELDQYRNGRRLKALAKWLKRNPGQPKPETLFLGEYDGAPLSTETIYEAWTRKRIFAGWSPHLARHTWACYTLLDCIRSSAKQVGVAVENLPASWVQSTFEAAMLLTIQPQLGHVSRQTTRAYLTWVNMHFVMPVIYEPWHEFLGLGS